MKASLSDLPISFGMLLAVALLCMFSFMILTDIGTEIDEHPELGLNRSYIDHGRAALQTLDYMIIFVIIGLISASIIFAFVIKTHPIFIVITLLMAIFFIWIGALYTNIFIMIAEDATMTATTDKFPLVVEVMKNLPLILVVAAALILIAMYMGKGSDGV